MTQITNFVWSLGAWNWFVVAAVMALLETIIPGIHFMWFGMAAVLMGGLVLAVPMSLPIQLIIFAVLSLAMILIARLFWSPQEIVTDEPDLNERGQQYR